MVAVVINKICCGYLQKEPGISVYDTDYVFLCRDSSLEQQDMLKVRKYLDRRRFEEGFLLLASLDVVDKHKISIEEVPFDKNKLVEMVTKEYQEQFGKKWTGIFLI